MSRALDTERREVEIQLDRGTVSPERSSSYGVEGEEGNSPEGIANQEQEHIEGRPIREGYRSRRNSGRPLLGEQSLQFHTGGAFVVVNSGDPRFGPGFQQQHLGVGVENGQASRTRRKRKVEEEMSPREGGRVDPREAVLYRAQKVVQALQSTGDYLENIQFVRKQIKYVLEMCKIEECLDDVSASGAIEMAVKILKDVEIKGFSEDVVKNGIEELERDIAFILGLMAIKVEHQQAICDANALPTLVAIVSRYSRFERSKLRGVSAQACRRAADAITNLAHENSSVKNLVRIENGIPPLVYLLESYEPKVQRAVAGTLRTLAFKNEQNKDEIVDLDALPLLIQMLRSDDSSIHYEAVGVIGNLVHSSQHIKVRVLSEGALQPVIDLLSSPCPDSQREAALLLGQFATVEADYKCKIVQRGAVPPLILMLSNADPQLKEMAAFALGRLAQNPDNQAGIVAMGGLRSLLELLASEHANLQHNAAFALYGLSENEDNLLHFVRDGAIQKIHYCNLGPQASRDCVQKMTKRLQEKLEGPVMGQLLYIMQNSEFDRVVIAVGLGLLCTEDIVSDSALAICDQMIKKGVLTILEDVLQTISVDYKIREQAATALANITRFCGVLQSPSTPSPPPSNSEILRGEQYVNNPDTSDVVFVVEGKNFHAHRGTLLAESEVFKSMFDGNYREKEATSIPIPNIRWPVFNAMMQCIYTGTVDVNLDIAQELLEAADQYMLESLKELCEQKISQHLALDNVWAAYELSESFDAPQLAIRCGLFCLDNVSQLLEQIADAESLLERVGKRLIESIQTHVEEAFDQSSGEEDVMEE